MVMVMTIIFFKLQEKSRRTREGEVVVTRDRKDHVALHVEDLLCGKISDNFRRHPLDAIANETEVVQYRQTDERLHAQADDAIVVQVQELKLLLAAEQPVD